MDKKQIIYTIQIVGYSLMALYYVYKLRSAYMEFTEKKVEFEKFKLVENLAKIE